LRSGYDEFDRLWRRIRALERGLREYFSEELRRAVEAFREEARALDRMLSPSWSHEGYLRPLYTVRDEGSAYVVYIDLPRADEGSIDVRFRDNMVLLRARLREGTYIKGWSSRASEVRFSEYRDVIELPVRVDPSKVKVVTRRGLVKIVIPKR